MSRLLALTAGTLTIIVVSACSTRSINSLYSSDESDVIADDRIIGTWVIGSAEEEKTRQPRMVIEKSSTRSKVYTAQLEMLPITRGKDDLRLVKLGDCTFADFYPSQGNNDEPVERRTHSICPIVVEENNLTMRQLSNNKLQSVVSASPATTPYIIRDGTVILSGSSDEVQQFFSQIIHDPCLFEEIVLHPICIGKQTSRASAHATTSDDNGDSAGPGAPSGDRRRPIKPGPRP